MMTIKVPVNLNKGWLWLILMLLAGCQRVQEPVSSRRYFSEKLEFTLDTLAVGLSNPWGMAFLPDGKVLITERPGRLRMWSDGKLLDKPVEGLPQIWAHGQGGLLDIILHPDYTHNGWIYLAYSRKDGTGGNTAIGRGKLQGHQLVDFEELFFGQDRSDAPFHFGCRMVFDDQQFLYFTIGDRGEMQNAQQLTNHNGKVMRIHDDGTVPSDNPFAGWPAALPEIWSYGHRNIQGMAVHPVSRKIWTHEHGPKGGDEINIITRGGNYGWPLATFGINYDGTIITPDTTYPGTIDPVIHWTPSIAPCGMTFVTGDRYPGWQGNLLVGALAGQHIRRLELQDDRIVHQEVLLEGFGRFRDVRQAPDGFIYLLTENPGLFLRLRPL